MVKLLFDATQLGETGVEVSLKRQCPYCHEMLTINGEAAHRDNVICCPICRKNVRIALIGLFNKRIELKKTSWF